LEVFIEDFVARFVNIGAVGIVAYVLFKNKLDENKENRAIYK